jgi:hypothetical protein
MIPKGLFTEIAMIALAIGIVVTYIRPTFADITKTQDDTLLYQTERAKIIEVNDTLENLLVTVDNVEVNDKSKLFTYLPDQVDSIAVPRTLSFMAEDAGLILIDVSYGGVQNGEQLEEDEFSPIAHVFSMSVEGSYTQIKRLVSMMERNEYPLEVRSLNISVLEGGFLAAEFEIATYSQNEPPLGIANSLNLDE